MDSRKKPQSPNNSVLLTRIGFILVAASFVFYGGILLIPFTPFSGSTKIVIGTTLAVLGEISFWVGGVILGKEVVTRYKKYLNPLNWLKKKKND